MFSFHAYDVKFMKLFYLQFRSQALITESIFEKRRMSYVELSKCLLCTIWEQLEMIK